MPSVRSTDSLQPKFKKHGSITYDARILTFKGLHLPHPQVSITTLEGRQLFNLVIAAYFAGRTNRVQGQMDLVYRKGKFFLYATCDMPEETPLEPDDVLDVDLSGINSRTTVRKKQRSERLSWAFWQLRSFITYKAALAGVPVILVDQRYTSQRCNACGHTEKANRKNQAEFECQAPTL
jgi:hypothetical protein